jgi:hypothetical protein
MKLRRRAEADANHLSRPRAFALVQVALFGQTGVVSRGRDAEERGGEGEQWEMGVMGGMGVMRVMRVMGIMGGMGRIHGVFSFLEVQVECPHRNLEGVERQLGDLRHNKSPPNGFVASTKKSPQNESWNINKEGEPLYKRNGGWHHEDHDDRPKIFGKVEM